MKIAFSTSGDGLDAQVDSRFGRAPKFLIYDTETKEYTVIDNTQNLNAAQGAGIQAAQNVARSGAQAVVTGHCGPKAFAVLQNAGIKVYPIGSGTIKEALNLFEQGKLEAASSPDVDGHWV